MLTIPAHTILTVVAQSVPVGRLVAYLPLVTDTIRSDAKHPDAKFLCIKQAIIMESLEVITEETKTEETKAVVILVASDSTDVF